jgi:hypothetical protein
MPEKIHADVALSFFEYRVFYRDAFLDFTKLYKDVVGGVFRSLGEWNVSLDNVIIKQNPNNLGEVSISFVLPGNRIVFAVGLGASQLLVTNPYWDEAEAIIKIGRAAISAVQGAAGIEISKQRASILMHLRPASGSIKDPVSSLVRLDPRSLPGTEIKAYGISVYKEDCTWLVDASASYPDALFVKIERTFGPSVRLEEIALQLKEDEKTILGLLKLEVD